MVCPYLKNKGSAVRFCLWPQMSLNLIRRIVHILLPTRRPLYRFLKSISHNYKHLDILEIGSGDTSINQSAEHIFPNAKLFVQTDVNNSYGHKYLDITSSVLIEEKFDLVLCNNVLEHIFDIKSAIKNLNYLLKEKGHLVVSVPFIYPLHDEPKDFWRFTEHGLKKLFSDFKFLKIKRTGIRQFPTQYILLLQKNE
jgi:SAM-dependent methyltransferase